MQKISKRDIILEAIIKAYLEENSPIGSSLLNERMDSEIPASTIRVYFKKLSDEGALTQLHISGGRVPTNLAMKQYWLERLDLSPIQINKPHVFRQIVEHYGVYCLIMAQEEATLDEIINVDDRFLLLVIGQEQIAFPYSEKVALFLEHIKGVSLTKLGEICAQVGLYALKEKLEHLIENRVLFQEGEMIVHKMTKSNQKELSFNFIIDSNFPNRLTDGLIFEEVLPHGYMGVKQEALFEGAESQMFCLGELYTDFESFFNDAKEEA